LFCDKGFNIALDGAIGLKNEATSQSAISAATLYLKDAYVNAWRNFYFSLPYL
jgi:hypothetical protein